MRERTVCIEPSDIYFPCQNTRKRKINIDRPIDVYYGPTSLNIAPVRLMDNIKRLERSMLRP